MIKTNVKLTQKKVKAIKPKKPNKRNKPDNKPNFDHSDTTSFFPQLKDRIYDLYVSPFTQWSVPETQAAITNLERGNFTLSGRLYDNMQRDCLLYTSCIKFFYTICS